MKKLFLEELLSASGGQVIGRVRLQKTTYLLDALGAKSGFFFSYHHYGPYSDDLSDFVERNSLAQNSWILEENRTSQSGLGYSSYSLTENVQEPPKVGALSIDVVRDVLARLNDSSSTVIELASTIHWLKKREGIEDWADELKARKGAKTEGGRQESAEALLSDIGLS